MERIVHKSDDFALAEQWDIEQQLRMTPQQRQSASRTLKERAYPQASKDVRACHRTE